MKRLGRNDIYSVSADVVLCRHDCSHGILCQDNLLLRSGDKSSVVGNEGNHIVEPAECILFIIGVIRNCRHMGYLNSTIQIRILVTVTYCHRTYAYILIYG